MHRRSSSRGPSVKRDRLEGRVVSIEVDIGRPDFEEKYKWWKSQPK